MGCGLAHSKVLLGIYEYRLNVVYNPMILLIVLAQPINLVEFSAQSSKEALSILILRGPKVLHQPTSLKDYAI